MSTELKSIKTQISPGKLGMTQYYGGTIGVCLQVTQGEKYIYISKQDAGKLGKRLMEFSRIK